MDNLTQTVSILSGIGPQSVIRLEKLGIHSIKDLLFHLPLRYEDRTKVYPINSLSPGMAVLFCGTVEFTEVLMKGRRSLVCRISDQTGHINLKFFHFSAKQSNELSPGTFISCFGEIRFGFQGREIIHPEYKIISSTENITEPCLTPIYPLTEGLRQSSLRKAIKQALSLYLQNPQQLDDCLPKSILAHYNYPSLSHALQALHQPESQITIQLQQGKLAALKRLAFEELLAHHLIL